MMLCHCQLLMIYHNVFEGYFSGPKPVLAHPQVQPSGVSPTCFEMQILMRGRGDIEMRFFLTDGRLLLHDEEKGKRSYHYYSIFFPFLIFNFFFSTAIFSLSPFLLGRWNRNPLSSLLYPIREGEGNPILRITLDMQCMASSRTTLSSPPFSVRMLLSLAPDTGEEEGK